jgi:hypothetical protein
MGGKIPADQLGFNLLSVFFQENYEQHVLLLGPSPVFSLIHHQRFLFLRGNAGGRVFYLL